MNAPPATVYLIEPRSRVHMNEPILQELSRSAVEVEHYDSYDELDLAGKDLSETLVLITSSCSRAVMERAPRLRAVINPYTGSEHIDRVAASQRLIIVGNGATPENYVGMAEATILLLLACFFNLAESERILRQQRPPPPITARLLRGKSIGLVGYGRIAQAVARRLEPWDVDLLVSAPRLHAPLPATARHVPLETLLAESDAVLVLCSLNTSTRNLLSRERLALMKPSAVLVNTARGGIIDEEAVADMLTDGRLRRAALDAFTTEPLPAHSRLREAPNAILTPHMIGHNVEAEESMARAAAESTRRVLAGLPPLHIFNTEIVDAWLNPERRR